MKLLPTLVAVVSLLAAPAVAASPEPDDPVAAARADIEATLGTVPTFFDAFPPAALPGAWQSFKALQLGETALSGKEKELIGLGVAAQIPCTYCIYAHTQGARANGATAAEISEAVAMAALTRHWSTVLNGSLADEAEFRRWVDAAFEHAGHGAGDAMPVRVVDAASARRDAAQLLGAAGPFFDAYPAAALPGAWQELKALQMSGDTALPSRTKELIGLAVAAQVPCRYCSYAHAKAARLSGASEEQVQEALAMAALTRHWSTWLNGTMVDERTFRAEMDAIFRHAAAMAGTTTAAH